MTAEFKIRSLLVNLGGAVIPDTVDMTDAMHEAVIAYGARAAQAWLDYHADAMWARNKLNAGLVLTEEALVYMEREVTSRGLAEQSRKKNLETENVKPTTAEPDGEHESAGTGERDVSGPSGPVSA